MLRFIRRAAALAAVLMLYACSQSAVAADIPSSASGDYVGGGWHCRLLAYSHPVYGYPSTVTEYRCTDPQTNQRYAARTWWGCPVVGAYSERLWPWWTSTVLPAPPDSYLTITAIIGDTLHTVIDGQPVQLSLAQTVQSPAPFNCYAPSALRFRVFGR